MSVSFIHPTLKPLSSMQLGCFLLLVDLTPKVPLKKTPNQSIRDHLR
jgi:hypothetical protein